MLRHDLAIHGTAPATGQLGLATLAALDRDPWSLRRHPLQETCIHGSSYEVDRDRIMASVAFAGLAHKTQVRSLATNPYEDIGFRPRLTHVLEACRLARVMARLLRANESLTEAIALAHDLGHPPFGHAGERGLQRALALHGHTGWNANTHSLHVVDYVERAFADCRGLNLTWAAREGIARHTTPFDPASAIGEFTTAHGGLECQIVDMADVCAYLAHDIVDALANGLIDESDLSGACGDLCGPTQVDRKSRSAEWPSEDLDAISRKQLVDRLIDAVVDDAVRASLARVEALGIDSPEDVRCHPKRTVNPSAAGAAVVERIVALVTESYYRGHAVSNADARAEAVIAGLFEALLRERDRLPHRFRIGDHPTDVATYIASLTDYAALRESLSLDVPMDEETFAFAQQVVAGAHGAAGGT